MSPTPRPAKISTRLLLSLGLVFALAAVVTVLLVRDELTRQAIAGAQDKARILLDNDFAIHRYITDELRPKMFEWRAAHREGEDYFEPSWMSASYALRRINQSYRQINHDSYYQKHCAIGARNPENEANDYERDFIVRANKDPNLVTSSKIGVFDGKPCLLFLRRGLVMQKPCLQCHGRPEDAPTGLIDLYGAQRGFNRELGKTVSAFSVRIPLQGFYGEAKSFSLRLSWLFLTVLGCLFLVQHILQRRLFFNPLGKIHEKALQIAASDEHLGERIDPPSGKELSDLTEAFNRMSENLKVRVSEREIAEDALQKAQALLEKRVGERTAELTRAYELLKIEVMEKNRVEENLRRSEIHLRNLYSRLLTSQEEERRKISKEVHDSIGSPLAAIKIGLENSLMKSAKGKVDPESFQALADLAQHAMRECGRIMTDLRPPVLDDYGIVAAIGWFCDRFQLANTGMRITKRIELDEKEFPESLRIVLFRIVQEALNNAARHSGAENITVSLVKKDRIELKISDDGCGFNLRSVLAKKNREGMMGIANMKERVELSGGVFQMETAIGKGTTVCARWSF